MSYMTICGCRYVKYLETMSHEDSMKFMKEKKHKLKQKHHEIYNSRLLISTHYNTFIVQEIH